MELGLGCRKAKKVSLFLWLILNQGVLTNKWRVVMGTSVECQLCHFSYDESIKHCLWVFPTIECVWMAVNRASSWAGGGCSLFHLG